MTSPTHPAASAAPTASSTPFAARSRAALLALVALALVAGMTALQAATAPPAAAHDVLVSTVPADGAKVRQVPDRVELLFEEPPLQLGTQVVVTGPGGRVQQGRPVIDGSTVRQAIAPGAPAGSYIVDYRVTSDDGHVVSGSFSFSATRAGAPGQAGTAPEPSATPLAGASASAPSASAGAPSPSASTPADRRTASPNPSSSAAAGGSSDAGMSWPVPPSILAWGIVLIVLILAALTWLLRRLRGRTGDDDEQS